MAHYEPLHQDLHCLQIQLCSSLVLKELRGHVYELCKLSLKTDVKKFFFTSKVITPWNNLSRDIIAAPSGSSFKHRF